MTTTNGQRFIREDFALDDIENINAWQEEPPVSLPKTPPRKRKSGKTKTKPATVATPAPADMLHSYTFLTVVVCAILSSLLNGYANALHSSVAWAGWLMGLIVPVIVLLLGKVSGLLYNRDNRPLAYIVGGTGAGLLLLSVWHCSESIALLTGSSLWLALPMAIAVDCGLISCELASIVERKREAR